MKNWLFAWQFTKVWVTISYGSFAKDLFEIVYISKEKLKFDRFLNGIGGSLAWFFLAGILISWVSSSALYKFFTQHIFGNSHFAKIGNNKGVNPYNCIYKIPLIIQFYKIGGILTAILTCAFYLFRILNRTSSKYSNLSLLLTEKTY